MKRILPLLTIGVLLYLGYTYALPVLKANFINEDGPTVSGMNEGAICVRKVQQTAQLFNKRWRRFEKGPIDETRFKGAMSEVLDRVKQTKVECGCNGEACREGTRALELLRQSIVQYHKQVLAGDTSPPKLTDYRDQVKRAAREARSENPL